MAENTKIEWATHTFNPWMGCTKVSPACKNCYAERNFDHRLKQVQWGPSGTRVLTSNENWAKPLKWNREAKEKGVRHRVFCASLADVFEDWKGPIVNSKGERGVVTCADSVWFTNGPVSNCRDLTMDDVRTQLFALIDATPNLDWLLLTKRPENIRRMWVDVFCDNHICEASKSTGIFCPHDSCDLDDGVRAAGRSNVWLGTTVEDQENANKRIHHLLGCRDLARVLFLSCEPLLGGLEIEPFLSLDATECCPGCDEIGCNCGAIDWVIAGGESGPEARPTDPEWFRSLRDQCQTAGVPFHFKQWGEWVPSDHDSVKMSDNEVCPWNDKPRSDVIDTKQRDNSNTVMCRVGKVRAGRLLDGVTHNGFPNE
jgi:protein gp37